jgi:S1-C subfamily serine protease
MRNCVVILVFLGAFGCAGSTAGKPPPSHPRAQAAPPPTVPAPATAAPVQAEQGEKGVVDDPQGVLPEQLEAGQISRGALSVVLSGGVGRFLARLRAEPKLEKGRFVGWRLASFAEGDATLRAGVLKPGDTVLRVNGQSIERPEQFKNVWDSLATSSDLVLQVERGGKHSEVRYRIVD